MKLSQIKVFHYTHLCQTLRLLLKECITYYLIVIHKNHQDRTAFIHMHLKLQQINEVSPMLTHIFQQSLDSGVVPTQWKHAYESPVFKKGSKTDPKNYRPILLMSVVCKSINGIHYCESNNETFG